MELSIIHGSATSSRVALTSVEWARCPILKIIGGMILVVPEEVEVVGAWEEEVSEVQEVVEAKDASAGIELMSTSKDVSIGAALLLPGSFNVYFASILRMSVED